MPTDTSILAQNAPEI